ncbi:HEPN domain-containing protein, partial [uncultured Alistipes sp.]
KAFPRDTEEEKRLFDLLQRAYIESRYNPDFEITKEDIDALIPKIEKLRDIVEKVCRERIAYYESKI